MLDIDVLNSDLTPVVDGRMWIETIGELPTLDGGVAQIRTNINASLSGSTVRAPLVRVPEAGFQITTADGLQYTPTIDTTGLDVLDIVLPPVVSIAVTGRVHGVGPDGDNGSVSMSCGSTWAHGDVADDFSYSVTATSFAVPSCTLRLFAEPNAANYINIERDDHGQRRWRRDR